MKKLFIHSCSDPLMWYADKVGQYVDYLGEAEHIASERDVYWSREPAGHKNIVFFDDAIIVDMPEAA